HLAGVPPRVLEVVEAGPQCRPAEAAQGGGEFVAETRLTRRGESVDRHPQPIRTQPVDAFGDLGDDRGAGLGQGCRFGLPPGRDRLVCADHTTWYRYPYRIPGCERQRLRPAAAIASTHDTDDGDQGAGGGGAARCEPD